MSTQKALRVTALVMVLSACGDPVAPPEPLPNISVTFTNRLYVPVRITVGTQDLGEVTGTKTVVFPGGTNAITWTPANRHYADGSEELDEFGAQTMLVANQASLEFTNEANATYFTPSIVNSTGVAISVAISSGGTMRCIGNQPATGSANWGYYRLTSDTEVRYFRASGGCSGAYRYWSTATLASHIAGKSGLILLSADVAP